MLRESARSLRREFVWKTLHSFSPRQYPSPKFLTLRTHVQGLFTLSMEVGWKGRAGALDFHCLLLSGSVSQLSWLKTTVLFVSLNPLKWEQLGISQNSCCQV